MSEHEPHRPNTGESQDTRAPDEDTIDGRPASETSVAARVAVVVAGLLTGALVVGVMPASWLFVSADDHAGHADHDASADTDAEQYACPMFCVVMDEMPEDGRCPVCGMDMTTVSGQSTLDEHERRMIGLQATRLERLPLVRQVRAVGEVDYAEPGLARITTRVAGWLQDVEIDTTWTEVERGQALASIYSPELYAAEQEFLVALRAHERSGAEEPGPLLRAARRRLELLEVDPLDVETLAQLGRPRDSVLLRAPHAGTVIRRSAVEGDQVRAGETLYTVADLSRVWVQAEVFEDDLPFVRVGQEARLQVAGSADPVTGRVAFVDPVLDRDTRTARVRIEIDNPAGPEGRRPLRIGQRVDVRLDAPIDTDGALALADAAADPPTPLAVPRTSVLRTGERAIVYVLYTDQEGHRDYDVDPKRLPGGLWYQPVELRLGPATRSPGGGTLDEYFPVVGVVPPRGDSGAPTQLEPGMTIVTHGNLLLDSQAQLSGNPSLLFPEGNRGASADPHAGH